MRTSFSIPAQSHNAAAPPLQAAASLRRVLQAAAAIIPRRASLAHGATTEPAELLHPEFERF